MNFLLLFYHKNIVFIKDLENINVLPMGKSMPNCEITLRNEEQIIKDRIKAGRPSDWSF